MSTARILIVHRDPAEFQALSACVAELGHLSCADESAVNGRIDLALIDLQQDARGIEAAARVGDAVPVLYLVGDVTGDVLAQARATGPVGCLVQPIDERQVRLSIQDALAAQVRVAGLQHRVALLESVLDTVSDGLAVADTDGRYLMVNPAGRRMAGIEPAQDLDERLSAPVDYRHADDMRPCRPEERPLARVLRGETFDRYELCIPSPSGGGPLYVSVSGRPLPSSDGTPRGGITIFADVSEAWAREQKLQALASSLIEQKEAMDAVLETMADGVLSIDRNGNVANANRSAARILRVRAPFTRQSPLYSGLFLPDQTTRVPPEEHPLSRALHGESVEDMHGFVRHADLPQGVHLTISARPLHDSRGNPVGAVGIFRDVTRLYKANEARQQATDDLRRQNHFMEMIFENISDGVVVADAKGALTMANGSAKRMVGMGLSDGPPETWSATYGTFFPDMVTAYPSEDLPLVRALHGEVSNNVELFIRNQNLPDGIHISVNGRPMRNSAGEVEGGVITLRDITQHVRAREALTQAFAHGRLEMLETVLHNLGNAVNSVAVGVGTLRDQFRRNKVLDSFSALARVVAEHDDDWIPWLESDPKGRQVRAFILSLADDFAAQSRRMLYTVDRVQNRVHHIVDIIQTQESSARGTIEHKVIGLRQAINDAVRVLQHLLTKHGIAIDMDCARAPDELRIQESRFHQTLVNLIKNAIEAIEQLANRDGLPAKPLIRILAHEQNDQLVLEVVDNGIGIDLQKQQSIFVAGYTTKKKGTGLGLHAAANFARDSGGEVRPFSDGVGRGTTMRMTLRLSPPPVQDQGTA